jgi:hypothetical protein
MITLTKITFTKKDAKILVKLLDTVGRELNKDVEDRSDSFKYIGEESIKRFAGSIGYKIHSSRAEEISITMKDTEEE